MKNAPKLIAIINKHQITPGNILLVSLTMWLTAIAVRGVIFWSVYHGVIPAVFVRGYHIHHFIMGFFMLIIAAVMLSKRIFSKYIPLTLAGSALGLVFDEFLYWTRGHFNYWSMVNLMGTVSIGFLMIAFYLYAKRYDLGHLSKKRIAATLAPILFFSALLYGLFHYQNLLSVVYADKNQPTQTQPQDYDEVPAP